MFFSPESIVTRALSTPNWVSLGSVSASCVMASSASAWPSHVMRVSEPPYTSEPDSPLGRAVALAVSSAYACWGANAGNSEEKASNASRKADATRLTMFAALVCMVGKRARLPADGPDRLGVRRSWPSCRLAEEGQGDLLQEAAASGSLDVRQNAEMP